MFNDTNAARGGVGKVQRRGLCGDVYLIGEPEAARIGDIKIDTSVRKGQISLSAALENLAPQKRYAIAGHDQRPRQPGEEVRQQALRGR